MLKQHSRLMNLAIRTSLGGLLLGLLAVVSGCAAAGSRESGSWLNLPSPWATLKAGDKPASGETSGSTRSSKANPDEESIAMAVLRGRNHERSGEWDKARKLYEELRDRHPDNPQIAHRLGVVADGQRRHEEAEHYFLSALEREPRNAELLADLGYCYFLQGQLTKAESATAKSVALEPSNSRYRNNLGLILGHQGRYDEALAHFRKSGSEADAYYNLAFIFAAQERVNEAKECFQVALNSDPTHRQAREALASFHEYDQRPAHLREGEALVGEEGRWIPFMEGSGDGSTLHSGDVAQASATGNAVTSRDASRATRALHMEARGMLNRNMQAQRADEMAAGGP